MNFNRLLNTDLGKIFISFIIGFGIATIFRNMCSGENCLVFNGPIFSEISNDKVYKYGNKCYKYNLVPDKCNSNKKIIHIDGKSKDSDPISNDKPKSMLTLFENYE